MSKVVCNEGVYGSRSGLFCKFWGLYGALACQIGHRKQYLEIVCSGLHTWNTKIDGVKARSSRFHISFIMYALRIFQHFFVSSWLYAIYHTPIIRFIIVHFSLSVFFIHLCVQFCSYLCIILFCLLHVLILCIVYFMYSSIQPLAAILQ